MNPIEEFFHMGGYAVYVWSSYALALVVLALNFVKPIYCNRRIRASLAHQSRLARRGT